MCLLLVLCDRFLCRTFSSPECLRTGVNCADVLYLAPGLSAQADRNFINIRRSIVFSIMTIQDIGDYYYYT